MWIPTQDEAVEMYARFLVARHGSAARRYAIRTADRLLAKSDVAGHTVWARVADRIEKLKSGGAVDSGKSVTLAS